MATVLETREHGSTNRVDTLALPKTFAPQFVEDKRSVYWENNLAKKWPCSEPTTFAGSQRVQDLANPKQLIEKYKRDPDKLSSMSVVSEGAKNAEPSARTAQLAQPKAMHRDYEIAKYPQWQVSKGAQTATASDRLEQLAQPKTAPDLKIAEDTEWEWSEWKSTISAAAKNAEASERVIVLAQPKEVHSSYQHAKSPFSVVSPEAKTAVASERLHKLAMPKMRTSPYEDDPNTYKVSGGALKAVASTRVSELAAPIARKQRAKKT